jgi:hypothetical protein
MGRPAKPTPTKVCKACGKTFERRRYNGRMEDIARFMIREHCSQACANTKEEVGLAGFRARAKKYRGRICEFCGATKDLHTHHKDSNPANNVRENIQTLCASCHIQLHWDTTWTYRRIGVSIG